MTDNENIQLVNSSGIFPGKGRLPIPPGLEYWSSCPISILKGLCYSYSRVYKNSPSRYLQ
jgi:hypothetical protein